jgi:hypothetical protein
MMMIAPFGKLALLAVVGLLVAGVIALLVAFRGRAVLWMLIGLAVLVVPAAGLLWYRGAAFHAVRNVEFARMERQREVARAAYEARPSVAPAPSAPLFAGEKDMGDFLADVYPSAEQAVHAAARNAARSIASVGASLPQPPGIRVNATGLPPGIVSQAVKGIESGLLNGPVSVEQVQVDSAGPEAPSTQPAAGAGKILCDIRVDSGEHGTATVTLRGPETRISSAADFRATPWAADFGRYSAAGAAGRKILAQSRRPCTSLDEAQRAALDDAAGQLLPAFEMAVAEGLDERGHTRPTWLRGPQLRRTVMEEIERDGAMILGRFPQRYTRPYGEIWRQTLLVNASSAAVGEAAQRFCAKASAMQGAHAATWGRLATTIGGLAVLVLAVYLVLNAATRGYYALVLRLAAITLVLGGTVTVLCMS